MKVDKKLSADPTVPWAPLGFRLRPPLQASAFSLPNPGFASDSDY